MLAEQEPVSRHFEENLHFINKLLALKPTFQSIHSFRAAASHSVRYHHLHATFWLQGPYADPN